MKVEEESEWKIGFTSSKDALCFVDCPCGENITVVDSKVETCKCGRMYFNQFLTYRITPDGVE